MQSISLKSKGQLWVTAEPLKSICVQPGSHISKNQNLALLQWVKNSQLKGRMGNGASFLMLQMSYTVCAFAKETGGTISKSSAQSFCYIMCGHSSLFSLLIVILEYKKGNLFEESECTLSLISIQ